MSARYLFRLAAVVCVFANGPALAQAIEGPARAAIEQRLGPAKLRKILKAHTFYGDFTGDGKADAMAVVYSEGEGNGFEIDALLFENAGGTFRFLKKAELFGSEPRNVRFQPGAVTLTTTMPRPGDPRCCPTGSKAWTIKVATGGAPSAPTANSSAPAGGPLTRKWCDDAGGYVQFIGNALMIDSGGDAMRFSPVNFAGCQGDVCAYRHANGKQAWTATARARQLTLRGPVMAGGNSGSGMTNTSLTFSACR